MLEPKVLSVHKDVYNYNEIFKDIKQFLEKSDYVIGNLETPISNEKKEIKEEQYRFTAPVEFALAVKNNGVDLVTTANNHCLDNGVKGAKKTIKLLDEIGLENTGMSLGNDNEYFIKKINNINIAFLSYTYGTNAFNNNVYLHKKDELKINLFQNQELANPFLRYIYKGDNILIKIIRKIFTFLGFFQFNIPVYERKEKSKKQLKKIKNIIDECKQKGADFIVMCMHAGGQYNDQPLPQTKKLARYLQRVGVDVIVGNHEHLVQNLEFVNGKLVTYCLGNFVSCSGVLEEPFDKMSDYSMLLHIYLSEDSNVVKQTFTITKTIVNEIDGEESIKVKLLYDLINECNDEEIKRKLIGDNNMIIRKFLGNNYYNNIIQEEYEIKL